MKKKRNILFLLCFILIFPIAAKTYASAAGTGEVIYSSWGYAAGYYNAKGQIVFNPCTSDYNGYREMGNNPKADQKDQLHTLWRPELAHIQEINRMPKYKEKSKDFVIGRIASSVPEALLKSHICTELFERDYNEIGNIIAAYRRSNRKKRRKR